MNLLTLWKLWRKHTGFQLLHNRELKSLYYTIEKFSKALAVSSSRTFCHRADESWECSSSLPDKERCKQGWSDCWRIEVIRLREVSACFLHLLLILISLAFAPFTASHLRHAPFSPFHLAIARLNLEIHTQSDVYMPPFARTRLKVLMKHVLSSLLPAVTEMAVFLHCVQREITQFEWINTSQLIFILEHLLFFFFASSVRQCFFFLPRSV